MFELTINGQVYQFRFGIGFLRDMNKTATVPVPDVPGKMKHIGAKYVIASIMDSDLESLMSALLVANKTESPRVTQALLDEYIEDESTDIDKLFEDVLDFLGKANATRKEVMTIQKNIEEAKQQRENQTTSK